MSKEAKCIFNNERVCKCPFSQGIKELSEYQENQPYNIGSQNVVMMIGIGKQRTTDDLDSFLAGVEEDATTNTPLPSICPNYISTDKHYGRG